MMIVGFSAYLLVAFNHVMGIEFRQRRITLSLAAAEALAVLICVLLSIDRSSNYAAAYVPALAVFITGVTYLLLCTAVDPVTQALTRLSRGVARLRRTKKGFGRVFRLGYLQTSGQSAITNSLVDKCEVAAAAWRLEQGNAARVRLLPKHKLGKLVLQQLQQMAVALAQQRGGLPLAPGSAGVLSSLGVLVAPGVTASPGVVTSLGGADAVRAAAGPVAEATETAAAEQTGAAEQDTPAVSGSLHTVRFSGSHALGTATPLSVASSRGWDNTGCSDASDDDISDDDDVSDDDEQGYIGNSAMSFTDVLFSSGNVDGRLHVLDPLDPKPQVEELSGSFGDAIPSGSYSLKGAAVAATPAWSSLLLAYPDALERLSTVIQSWASGATRVWLVPYEALNPPGCPPQFFALGVPAAAAAAADGTQQEAGKKLPSSSKARLDVFVCLAKGPSTAKDLRLLLRRTPVADPAAAAVATANTTATTATAATATKRRTKRASQQDVACIAEALLHEVLEQQTLQL